jgi:hypothetical protein
VAAEEAAETLGVVKDGKRGAALSAQSKKAGGEEKDNDKTQSAGSDFVAEKSGTALSASSKRARSTIKE